MDILHEDRRLLDHATYLEDIHSLPLGSGRRGASPGGRGRGLEGQSGGAAAPSCRMQSLPASPLISRTSVPEWRGWGGTDQISS